MSFKTQTFNIHSSIDGTKLFCRSWKDKSANEAIVINHGFGEHSGRYQHIVEFFKNSQYNLFSFDMRGHGKSDGKRGHVSDFELFTDDLSDFIKEIRKRENIDKVYLLGHSLGGVVALNYTLEGINQDYLHALILSSPALKIKMDLEKHIKKFVASFLSKILPSLTLDANIDPSFISHDPKEVEAYKTDPLIHGKISFKLGYEFFRQFQYVKPKLDNLRTPILILHGEGDKIIDYSGSIELYNNLSYKNKRVHTYPGLYHELMNETIDKRTEVLTVIRDFIEERQKGIRLKKIPAIKKKSKKKIK